MASGEVAALLGGREPAAQAMELLTGLADYSEWDSARDACLPARWLLVAGLEGWAGPELAAQAMEWLAQLAKVYLGRRRPPSSAGAARSSPRSRLGAHIGSDEHVLLRAGRPGARHRKCRMPK